MRYFRGKVAVVTGGAGGIGMALALDQAIKQRMKQILSRGNWNWQPAA